MCYGISLCLCMAILGGSATEEATAGEAERVPAVVQAGCEHDYPPFCLVGENQQADGFSVALLRAALRVMGREVTFKTAPWPELKQDLSEGRLQALPMMARSPERESQFDFTFPYYTLHGTIVVRDDNADIHGVADLRGKRVAVLQEDIAHEYLRRSNLGAVIVPLPSFTQALRELSEGQHDAVVIQKLLALQIMKQLRLSNLLTIGPPLTGYRQVFCMGVRKGDTELLSLLNEGLSIVMADGTFRQLHAQWFSALEAVGRTRSRIVVGGDANYPPFEFLDSNGQPQGYCVDLTRAIARQMGLSIDIHLGPWTRVRADLDRREIDVLQGMYYSQARDRSFDFSPPHALIQHVIVVRQGTPPPNDMQDLAGKSILAQSGDILHDLAVEHGYEKQLILVENQEEALRRLAAGKGDCALVARVPALYWTEKHGWSNLVIGGQPLLSTEYCYAVPEGRHALLAEFSEGLAAIKKTGEYRRIQAKWLGAYEDTRVDVRAMVKYAILSAIPLLALLVGSLLWTRSLKAQVRERTGELQAAKTAAEQANLAKDHFLAVLSHELRTPLTPVVMGISVLQGRTQLAAEDRETLEMIRRNVEMEARLIDDLLDVTRFAQGKIDLQRGRVDVCTVIHRAVEVCTPDIEARGLHLTMELGPDAPYWVNADVSRLEQVFWNVLKNAIKFTPHEGCIGIRCLRQQDEAVVSVTDSGIGIEPAELCRIFNAFEQAERAINRQFGGLGLGLAICKTLVEMHGGAITAHSEGRGKGATFRIRLPLYDSERRLDAAPPSAPPQCSERPLRILLVEDHSVTAKMMSMVLSAEGHAVETASDIATALQLAAQHPFDLLLSDLGLPDGTGHELLRELRAQGHAFPGIALSGYGQDDDIRRSREAGFAAHLTKPASREILTRTIVELSGRMGNGKPVTSGG